MINITASKLRYDEYFSWIESSGAFLKVPLSTSTGLNEDKKKAG